MYNDSIMCIITQHIEKLWWRERYLCFNYREPTVAESWC